MSKKGYTAPLSAQVRTARLRRKAVSQLRDLIVCMEFYYDHREDYTASELAILEETVVSQRDVVQRMLA